MNLKSTMKKICLLFFLFNLFFLTVVAQNNSAYIIQSEGDTIFVEEIKEPESSEKVLVQVNGRSTSYSPDEIMGFWLKDRAFLSKKVKSPGAAGETQRFVEEVLKGYVSLYRTKYAGEKKKYYVNRLNDPVTYEISRTYYHNFISFYFEDCQDIVEHNQELWKSRFKYDLIAMFELVKQYNDCIAPGAKQVVRIFPEKRTVFYAVAGLGFLHLSYKGRSAASVQPLAGVGVKYRYFKNFFVGSELLFTRKGGAIDYSFEVLKGARYYVQLPVLLGFTFNPGSASQVSLIGGGSLGYAFADTYEPIGRPDELLLLTKRAKFSTAYLLGLELARKLNNDKRLVLSARYDGSSFSVDENNASFGSNMLTFNERSLSLLLKYEF